MAKPRRTLEQHRENICDRFGLLLALLVGSFVVSGFAEHAWARAVAGLLELVALAVAFLATGLRRDHRWLGLLATVGVLGLVLTSTSGDVSKGVGAVASLVVLSAILVAVLDRVLRHRRISIQTLFGAVCAYFLIGLMFSSLYSAMDDFGSQPIFGEAVNRSVFSYFSFTTLTTVGFGDYTAETDLARRIVVLEAVIGQVFLATTLARLVSLYKSAPQDAG